MKELPHQELRNQYYEEKKTNDEAWEDWEWKDNSIECWRVLMKDPEFRSHHQYRRKPSFIEINGFQVPEPYRGEMNVGQVYYEPRVSSSGTFYLSYVWRDSDFDKILRRHGLVHLTDEAAIIHAKAILSFTNPEIKP